MLSPSQQKRPRSFTWRVGQWLNQGFEGRCVEFAICHDLLARPVSVVLSAVLSILANKGIYWPAQREDEWEGGSYPGAVPQYEGTSVLAGMKIAARLGFFSQYRWCFGIQDLVQVLGYWGPVILGINWHRDMRDPDADGFIHPTGPIEGGHAILAHAVVIKWNRWTQRWNWWGRSWEDVDLDKSYVWLWNSWGPDWGDNGRCKITLRELEQLLLAQGEAAVPVTRHHAVAA
jgi:hypothetical protein